MRLARLLALASLAEHEVEVDAAAVASALTAIREQLELVRTAQVAADLDLQRHQGGLDRAGLDALRHPRQGGRSGVGDPRRDVGRASLTMVLSGLVGSGTVGDA